jgi:hypothetical protein
LRIRRSRPGPRGRCRRNQSPARFHRNRVLAETTGNAAAN